MAAHRHMTIATMTLLGLATAGCATAPLDRAGSLLAYDDLTPSDGLVTRTLLKVAKDDVLAAQTVRIAPTTFSDAAGAAPFTPAQRNLVANAVRYTTLSSARRPGASGDPGALGRPLDDTHPDATPQHHH